MAVSITKYPGGLEQPTAWESNIQGLTPLGTYLVSFEEALKKFPGLQYSKEFQEAQKSNTTYGASAPAPTQTTSPASVAPTDPSSVIDIKVAGPEIPQESNEALYNEAGQTYDISQPKYEPATEQPIPQPKYEAVSEQKTPEQIIEAFENKLLDQAKGEAVDWPTSPSSEEVAQSLPSIKKPADYGPPVVAPWNKGMPSVPGNVPGNPPFQGGPSQGTYPMALGPRGEQLIAEVKYGMGAPKVPAWMKAIDDDYKKNINKPIPSGPVRNSGKGALDTWEGPGGWGASAPGTSIETAVATATAAPDVQKAGQTFQSEYDPQKAKLAAAASKSYKVGSDNYDPFKSSVFG
jgi:hypothetical protein